MKKTVFFFGLLVIALSSVSCSTDDLELSDNNVNQEILIDDFDYSGLTNKDGEGEEDEEDNVETNNLDNTDPVTIPPKKD